jgi:hypothetical protein
MQMRIGSSACVRSACRPPRVARNVAVQRAPVRMAPSRDTRAWFFKLGGKSGSDEAYSASSVSIPWNVRAPRRKHGGPAVGAHCVDAASPAQRPRARLAVASCQCTVSFRAPKPTALRWLKAATAPRLRQQPDSSAESPRAQSLNPAHPPRLATSHPAPQSRADYNADDVEHYFNYMGCLAVEGTYDRMEEMMQQGVWGPGAPGVG